MKKKIIIAFMAAIGLSTITFMRQNPRPEHLTDLQLENIEAIANDEEVIPATGHVEILCNGTSVVKCEVTCAHCLSTYRALFANGIALDVRGTCKICGSSQFIGF